MSESMAEDADGVEWRPAGARKVRSRTETNRIITITGDALETSGFEDGSDVAIYVDPTNHPEGVIRLERWTEPIPPDLCGPGGYRPAGVREVHSSGTSIIVTLTDRALQLAGFETGTPIQEWAREDGLKLTADGPDVEGDA